MGLSGFAGLGFQIVWTQQFGVWLGHEIVAVLAIVAAFFGGLALGAHLLGRRIAASRHPARWYAGCEVTIGLWGVVLAAIQAPAGQWLASLTGTEPSTPWQWCVAFLGPLILLLPSTAAMGATLPALERVTGRMREEGFAIGALYAANTAGAVAGVLGCTFVLVPAMGLTNTALACACANFLCAILTLTFASVRTAGQALPADDSLAESRDSAHPRLGLTLFATGLLGIGFEVLVVRVVSQIAEDTVYTFAILLAVYLLGTALGAALYHRTVIRLQRFPDARGGLLAGLSAACLVSTLILRAGDMLHSVAATALGHGMSSGLLSEAIVSLAAFGLPTVLMGALFSHLCVEARAAGMRFGTAIALNTAGGAIAPPVFGVLLVPAAGPGLALAAVAGGYLALGAVRTGLRWPVVAGAFGLAAVAWAGGPIAFVDAPPGSRIVSYKDGVMASVSVVEDESGVARLRIDNREQEGTNASFAADARMAYLPLLLHPAPTRALFLGLGTGVTTAAAAEDPTLKVDVVELVPEVIDASAFFTSTLVPEGGHLHARVIPADARRFVRTAAVRYDVVVADLFHPARSGSGALYTTEHFTAVRARLADDGLFCQWLPLHQLDIGTLRSIVRSFQVAFPEARALLATGSLDTPVIGLVGRARPGPFHLNDVMDRASGFALAGQAARVGLPDAYAVLGTMIAGPSSLARFADRAPLNTDDRPVVAHSAPRITYAPESTPRERLAKVLEALRVAPVDVLGQPGDEREARFQDALARYWRARDRFIAVGMNVRPTPDPAAMLAQVGQPLLAIVTQSPEFRPAYDPLLNIAAALATADAPRARDLLEALSRANPAREDARALLARIAGPHAGTASP